MSWSRGERLTWPQLWCQESGRGELPGDAAADSRANGQGHGFRTEFRVLGVIYRLYRLIFIRNLLQETGSK